MKRDAILNEISPDKLNMYMTPKSAPSRRGVRAPNAWLSQTASQSLH